MTRSKFFTGLGLFNISVALIVVNANAAEIHIDANKPLHEISRYLTGACLEDVNHEVYGGIDSQMVFGESFAEPAPRVPLAGFKTFGNWSLADGAVRIEAGEGSKLIAEAPLLEAGQVAVELRFDDAGAEGNAGLIVKTSDAGSGADDFNGYEVSIEPSGNLVLGRHRQNWEFIRRVPCDVPGSNWVALSIRMQSNSLAIAVNGKPVTEFKDTEHPLQKGAVGLRTWHRDASFRNFTVRAGGETQKLNFVLQSDAAFGLNISRMWRPVRKGSAEGQFALERDDAFSGSQSQTITFSAGKGEIGIENQGLNRRGMNFLRGKAYEGYIYARARDDGEVFVALESKDGRKVYAERRLKVSRGKWQRLDFTLKPDEADPAGRFAIKLKQPGSVTVGYAFLQPGAWGRFQNLPVRKDVAEGLIHQGVTVLRYGGCMANAEEYRWKKILGPREQRPPYRGWWYPQSSNGWGIFDFLNFCEAAGFLAIPDVNASETPADMADFIEYVNGPVTSEWGRKRAAAGHPKPYNLKYLEIGNEERVNEAYWQKFKPLAEAIWAKDPAIVLVVGDFTYNEIIRNPFNFSGADGHITSLAAQQKILQLAKQHDREVWFDLHVWTEGPRPARSLDGMFSYTDALEKVADGARHRVVVFELNANNHAQRRALANAVALNAICRDGRLPIVTSANCLQPDGQNDNGWDQGLLFLDSARTWSQPPGDLMGMFSRSHQPLLVQSEVQDAGANLDVVATRSKRGDRLSIRAVNLSDSTMHTIIDVKGFVPASETARVEELSGSLNDANTSANPEHIVPRTFSWQHGMSAGRVTYPFPPHSVTIIEFR